MKLTRGRSIEGFTLLEALVSLTLAALIMLGVFHSSFIATRATAQTEQGLEAENLIASRFSKFLSETSSYTLPYSSGEDIQTKSARYTLTKTLIQDPQRPYCARASVTLSWKQGRILQSKKLECLVPLKNPSGTSL